MAEGWIKLHRAIRKNWIWEDAQKLKWWLDILLQANHQEKKVLLGNELVLIERGSFHTSELKLAKKWGVSKTTVRKFLELLESDRMITTIKSKKGTTLKVSNYEDYQGFSDEEKTDKKPQKNHNVDHKKTIEEPYGIQIKNHKVDTNNNDKELYKNEEEGKEGKEGDERLPSLPPLSFPTPYHETIFNQWSENTYRTWFMNTEIEDKENEIIMVVGYELAKDIIETKFNEQLETLLDKKVLVILKK
ncbi:hypothetical protein [Clostridium sp. UBA7791]|uniref:hypothetical protein n=1 Tax=Clostridium sp. UBA7791 TaxID=1946379 RepID=UPI0032171AEF